MKASQRRSAETAVSLQWTPPTEMLALGENAGSTERSTRGVRDDSVSENAAAAASGAATTPHVCWIADRTTLGSARASERFATPPERSAAVEFSRTEPAAERENPLEGGWNGEFGGFILPTGQTQSPTTHLLPTTITSSKAGQSVARTEALIHAPPIGDWATERSSQHTFALPALARKVGNRTTFTAIETLSDPTSHESVLAPSGGTVTAGMVEAIAPSPDCVSQASVISRSNATTGQRLRSAPISAGGRESDSSSGPWLPLNTSEPLLNAIVYGRGVDDGVGRRDSPGNNERCPVDVDVAATVEESDTCSVGVGTRLSCTLGEPVAIEEEGRVPLSVWSCVGDGTTASDWELDCEAVWLADLQLADDVSDEDRAWEADWDAEIDSVWLGVPVRVDVKTIDRDGVWDAEPDPV